MTTIAMDFDEYDYLEKTVESIEPLKNADRRKSEHDDGHRSRKDDSTDRRRSHDRSRQDDRTKKTRVSDDAADRPERERERSERGRKEERREERERHSHDRGHERERPFYEKGLDRERPERDSRDRERRDQGRTGGWHNGGGWGRGGRDRFFGRNRDFDRGHFGGRGREREDRHFDRVVEREDKPSDVDNEHGGSRYSREKKDKKEEGAATEPEADPERDQRTVFAFQISLKADERDVYDFFSKAGKVRDVRLIMDRNLRRSKGVGYVEFYDAMSVPMAIAMTGQLLLGQPVMVKPSEAEKNLVQSTASTGAGAMGPYTGGARRLYVGNLHYNITDVQLRQVFEPFGIVEFVQLPTEPEGQSKGYAFIQFARLEDARSAQTSLNGNLQLAGRVIKVLAVTEQMNMQEPGLVPGELDDDEGGGLTLTAQSRTLLMQKLDRSGTSTSVTPSNSAPVGLPSNMAMNNPSSLGGSALTPSGLPGVVGLSNAGLAASAAAASIGSPTECILLKNMFDPTTETEADFDLDIKDEVLQECSKFGPVKHIYVDKMSAGHVYLRFDVLNAATGAQRALHGRWFAGKMITVTFLTIPEYELKFPESS